MRNYKKGTQFSERKIDELHKELAVEKLFTTVFSYSK